MEFASVNMDPNTVKLLEEQIYFLIDNIEKLNNILDIVLFINVSIMIMSIIFTGYAYIKYKKGNKNE